MQNSSKKLLLLMLKGYLISEIYLCPAGRGKETTLRTPIWDTLFTFPVMMIKDIGTKNLF